MSGEKYGEVAWMSGGWEYGDGGLDWEVTGTAGLGRV